MKTIKIPNSTLDVSEISLGCMRIANLPTQEAATLLNTA